MKNSDAIRQMTDEELADFICGIFTIEYDLRGRPDPYMVVTKKPWVELHDKEELLNWLKQEERRCVIMRNG